MSRETLKKSFLDEKVEEEKEIRGKDPPGCVPWPNPYELQATDRDSTEDPGTSGTRHVVSSARHQDTSPGVEASSRPGSHRHVFLNAQTLPGAVSVRFDDNGLTIEEDAGVDDDGITIEEENNEQVTIEPDEKSTVHVIARAVDTEEESRLRDEHDQAIHELDQLHQMLNNAPIVIPVVTTNSDVENQDENIHANHDDLPQSEDRKCGTRGRRWFAMSAILLIVVAVAVTLALVLQSEPTPSEPTPSQDLIELLSSASSDGGVALADPSTTQNMALKWIAGDPNLASYSDQEKIQRYALATLYFTTKGDSWNNTDNWLSYEPACGKWFNSDDSTIICTTDGAVSELVLEGNNLQGIIPPEIGMLSDSLVWLWLGVNALEGDIPTEIGKLTKLSLLSLWNNSLIGTIPNELGILTKLIELDLETNLLTGTIPLFIGTFTDLDFLAFEFNNLSGEIPSELGILTKLTYLSLGLNELIGTIPSELGLLTILNHLSLHLNGFTGTVPTSLASLTLLKSLYLEYNDLTGSVDALCGINFENFTANACGQVEIDCQCCTHCCYLVAGDLDSTCELI